MEWSLGLLFGLIVLTLFLFKKCEEFKGGRIKLRGGRRTRKFDIVDVVFIVLIIYYLFLNK